MKRIVKNQPPILVCAVCDRKYSAYALATHIKQAHFLSSDTYESRYGVFRHKKVTKRIAKKLKCHLCKSTFSTVGMHTHLRDSHKMNIDEYVNKFGEFRVNVLKKKEESTESCLICNDATLYNAKALTWHLKQIHGMSKLEYVKAHILGGKQLLCECGCGQEIHIATYKPYVIRKFLTGHNSGSKTSK